MRYITDRERTRADRRRAFECRGRLEQQLSGVGLGQRTRASDALRHGGIEGLCIDSSARRAKHHTTRCRQIQRPARSNCMLHGRSRLRLGNKNGAANADIRHFFNRFGALRPLVAC